MRQERTVQACLFDLFAEHEIGRGTSRMEGVASFLMMATMATFSRFAGSDHGLVLGLELGV
jgi:hypothetical protein